MAKVHVFLVKHLLREQGDNKPDRLIRGTLKDVEAKLRAEVSIESCTAETAHQMADVQIEDCE